MSLGSRGVGMGGRTVRRAAVAAGGDLEIRGTWTWGVLDMRDVDMGGMD